MTDLQAPRTGKRTKRTAPHSTAEELWQRYRAKPDLRLREQLFEEYRPLAYGVLQRFSPPFDEDLEQVALLGLLRAIDRFEADRGVCFTTFAVPTILGELRRYRRDCTRVIRAPRRAYELRTHIQRADQELLARDGREPTLAEIAAHLDVDVERIAEALELERRCRPYALDGAGPRRGNEAQPPLEAVLGAEDPGFAAVELRVMIGAVLPRLENRLQGIVHLRYFEGLSQKEVGQRLGCSQMHVSRLERRALATLRTRLKAAGLAADREAQRAPAEQQSGPAGPS